MTDRLWVLVLALLVASCAGTGGRAPSGDTRVVATVKAAPLSRGDSGWLQASELPAGFHSTDGRSPLGLRILLEDGRIAEFEPVALQDANVVVSFADRDSRKTMVDIRNSLGEVIKFDLYISPDGQRFTYTSSCPVIAAGSAFEIWPYAVSQLAIGNPRVVAGGDLGCH